MMYAMMSPSEIHRNGLDLQNDPRKVYMCTSVYLIVFSGLYAASFTMPFWSVGSATSLPLTHVTSPMTTPTVPPASTSTGNAENDTTTHGPLSFDNVWRFSWEYVGLVVRCLTLLLLVAGSGLSAHRLCCRLFLSPPPTLPVLSGVVAGVMGIYGEVVLWMGVEMLAPNAALLQSQMFCTATSALCVVMGLAVYIITVPRHSHAAYSEYRRQVEDAVRRHTEDCEHMDSLGEGGQREDSSAAARDDSGRDEEEGLCSQEQQRSERQSEVVVYSEDRSLPSSSPIARRHSRVQHETVDCIAYVQNRLGLEQHRPMPERRASDGSNRQVAEIDSGCTLGRGNEDMTPLEGRTGDGDVAQKCTDSGNDTVSHSFLEGRPDNGCSLPAGGTDEDGYPTNRGTENENNPGDGCTENVAKPTEGSTDSSNLPEDEAENDFHLAEGSLSPDDNPTGTNGFELTPQYIDDDLFYNSSDDNLLETFIQNPDEVSENLDASRTTSMSSTSRLIATSQKALMLSFYGSEDEYLSLSDEEEHDKNKTWP